MSVSEFESGPLQLSRAFHRLHICFLIFLPVFAFPIVVLQSVHRVLGMVVEFLVHHLRYLLLHGDGRGGSCVVFYRCFIGGHEIVLLFSDFVLVVQAVDHALLLESRLVAEVVDAFHGGFLHFKHLVLLSVFVRRQSLPVIVLLLEPHESVLVVQLLQFRIFFVI